MSAASSELLRLSLCCDSLAPGHARDALECLGAVRPVREDAVLLVSELVSTAVIATGTDTGDESLELIASEVPDGVQLSVAADGQHDEPRPAPLMARVIETIARRWGIEHRGGKARVWAELAI